MADERSLPASPNADAVHRKELRMAMRSRRRRVDALARSAASQKAAGTLLRTIQSRSDSLEQRRIALYHPFDGEISALSVVPALIEIGWSTWMPAIGDGKSMTFHWWAPDSESRPNRFGILEPPSLDPTGPEPLSVVVMPCVAVDLAGNRLGMGAGYYDRALSDLPDSSSDRFETSVTSGGSDDSPMMEQRTLSRRPLLIGMVFDFQIIESLPSEPWDIPVDLVISESRTIEI